MFRAHRIFGSQSRRVTHAIVASIAAGMSMSAGLPATCADDSDHAAAPETRAFPSNWHQHLYDFPTEAPASRGRQAVAMPLGLPRQELFAAKSDVSEEVLRNCVASLVNDAMDILNVKGESWTWSWSSVARGALLARLGTAWLRKMKPHDPEFVHHRAMYVEAQRDLAQCTHVLFRQLCFKNVVDDFAWWSLLCDDVLRTRVCTTEQPSADQLTRLSRTEYDRLESACPSVGRRTAAATAHACAEFQVQGVRCIASCTADISMLHRSITRLELALQLAQQLDQSLSNSDHIELHQKPQFVHDLRAATSCVLYWLVCMLASDSFRDALSARQLDSVRCLADACLRMEPDADSPEANVYMHLITLIGKIQWENEFKRPRMWHLERQAYLYSRAPSTQYQSICMRTALLRMIPDSAQLALPVAAISWEQHTSCGTDETALFDAVRGLGHAIRRISP